MIDTERVSAELRNRSIDVQAGKILIARLAGSDQEPDLSEPVNCRGLGRIRHFGRPSTPPWPANPLPGNPARRHLGNAPSASEAARSYAAGAGAGADQSILRAQVFQNASCNWRCWYCYVPFNLLAAHPSRSEWATPGELVDLWQEEPDAPSILDLSGGQPDLVPEWVPWTMRALTERGLSQLTYLWSDDNLSTDYLWRYLSDDDLALMSSYPGYGRAVCFKGIDEESFALNTAADPSGYLRQFRYVERLIDLRIDLYCYVTLPTTCPDNKTRDLVAAFVDRLQQVHPSLPLRTVPLQVSIFGPVVSRLREQHKNALSGQERVITAWLQELQHRYGSLELECDITEVSLASW